MLQATKLQVLYQKLVGIVSESCICRCCITFRYLSSANEITGLVITMV